VGSKADDHTAQQVSPDRQVQEEWNGIKKGDEVYIVGDLTGVYRFQGFFIEKSGAEVVQLYGGPPNHRKARFVGADVVSTSRAVSAPVSGADGPSPSDTPVGDFRARREELRLSRTKLAELAGTTHAAVASVEAGRAARDKDAAVKMSEVLWPTHSIDAPPVKGCAGTMGMPDSIIEDEEDEEDEW
jgi:DNA-binding XRE family transcriptional regulator